MELKYIAIMVSVMFGMAFAGLAHSDYQKAEVLKACYEAAKTNTNITCENK